MENGKWKIFSKEPEFIKDLFNSISENYDKLNDIMSFGLHKKIKRDVINQIENQFSIFHFPFSILDLCTGTGDLAAILKEKYPEAKIIGIDFSPQMLEIARQKHNSIPSPLVGEGEFLGEDTSLRNSCEGYNNIDFLEADCTNLPFEDESFDLCTISFGLRNIEDMEKALQEIHRVLKKGGIFVNLDLGKPNKFFNLFLKPYMYVWVAFLGKVFHKDETPYKYLAASNETFPAPAELIKIYEKIGFSNVKSKNYLFGQIAAQISLK